MPRQPRAILSKSFYHVMTRGNNKNVVFRDDDDYKYYLELIYRFKPEHPFSLYHYCLMPTHIHLEIQTKIGKEFSIFMKKINLAYFHYYRRKYSWVGHFWQDRFKSQPVGKDSYFIQCGKYIELNPIRKGLVKKPEEWPYSSYRYYFQGLQSDLITPDFLYEEIGKNSKERQRRYSALLIDQKIKESYGMEIWGSDLQRYQEKKKVRQIQITHKTTNDMG